VAKFRRTQIAAGGFRGESAAAIVAACADLVAFGRHFTPNPDVPERLLRGGLPLNRYNRSTFYSGDGRGYIDYPMHIETSGLTAG
jgi:N-ethylmaleimide reductase